MPFGGNKWELKKMVPYAEMLAIIRERYPSLQPVASPTFSKDVSKACALWVIGAIVRLVQFNPYSVHFDPILIVSLFKSLAVRSEGARWHCWLHGFDE